MKIFEKHQKRYGYRRLTLSLHTMGIHVNHKKVRRLMKKFQLVCLVRKKRKYSSYKGKIGPIAENLIQREFKASQPNQKWYSDVTEFNLRGEKLYLSPILDGHGGYIISYSLSTSPDMRQIKEMFDQAFKKVKISQPLIFHTDQGYQYQHSSTIKRLKEYPIKQSMSRKGNSLDNGMMESFFSTIKTEMFYGQESRYKNLRELESAIKEYIHYYNTQRIKITLKGLTPEQFRNQSLS